MSQVMLDSAFAPSPAQAQALRGQASRWAGYLPSPRAFHAWSRRDFETVAAAGFEVLGIYVGFQHGDPFSASMGLQHGRDAVNQADILGLAPNVPLVLDVEAGATGADAAAYAYTWARAVQGNGRTAVLYCALDFAPAGHAFNDVWIAAYPSPVPQGPSPDHIPGLADTFAVGRRAWQYQNSHQLGGVSVDTSVVDEAFAAPAQEQPMTPQEKQAQDLVDSLLVRDMYLGRTSSIGDVRFTAARMVALGADAGMWEITGSPEAIATGGLIGKVAALQVQVAALVARLTADEQSQVAAAGGQATAAAVAQLQAEMAAIAKAAAA